MAHSMDLVVRFADLDPYGHVNHARYLSFFESARIELLSEIGFGMNEMQRDGYQIVLVELTARFHAPAVLHDRLAITTRVSEVRRATTTWSQEARRGSDPIASVEVTAAFTGLDGRPVRSPEGFRQAAMRLDQEY